MARVKKRGLDYFPINTDFIHDRAVRRLLKREGDASLTILLEVLSYIYGGEGYYVRADSLLYEDLSTDMYENSAADVERIIRLAVGYGLFDAGLFEEFGILTSAEIQEQYLFSTRRRTVSVLEADYCLLETEKQIDRQPATPVSKAVAPIAEKDVTEDTQSIIMASQNRTGMSQGTMEPPQSRTGIAQDSTKKIQDRTEITQYVTETTENVTEMPSNVTSGTHSIAQNSIAQNSIAKHSVAQNSKKYPLFLSPPERTGKKIALEGQEIDPNGEEKEEIFSVNTGGTNTCGADASCTDASCTPKRTKRVQTPSKLLPHPPTDYHATMQGNSLHTSYPVSARTWRHAIMQESRSVPFRTAHQRLANERGCAKTHHKTHRASQRVNWLSAY